MDDASDSALPLVTRAASPWDASSLDGRFSWRRALASRTFCLTCCTPLPALRSGGIPNKETQLEKKRLD